MSQVLDPSCSLWSFLRAYVKTVFFFVPLTICLLYSTLRLIKCDDASEASILCTLSTCAFYGIVVSSLWKDDMEQHHVNPNGANLVKRRPIVLDVSTWSRHDATCQPTLSCPMCLEVYQRGDVVSCGKACRHVYHADCIGRWTALGHTTCPCCRQELKPKPINVSWTRWLCPLSSRD